MRYLSTFLMLFVLGASLVAQAAPDFIVTLYGEPSEETPCRAAFAPLSQKWVALSMDASDQPAVEALVAKNTAPHRDVYAKYAIPKASKLRARSFWHGMKIVDPTTGVILGFCEIDRMARADFSAHEGRTSILENYVTMGVMEGPDAYKPEETLYGKFNRIEGKGLAQVRLFLDCDFASGAAPGSEIDTVSSVMRGVMAYMKHLSSKGHLLHTYPSDKEVGPVHAVMSYTTPSGTFWEEGMKKAGFRADGLNQAATPAYWLDYKEPEDAEALAQYQEKKSQIEPMRTMWAPLEAFESTMEEQPMTVRVLLDKIDAVRQ